MKCHEVREIVPSLAAEPLELSPEIQEHLQVCAPCAAQLQAFRQTMALLDEWEAPEPSAYFDTRLQVRLREEKAAEGSRQAWGWFGWLRSPALAATAALLLVTGGVGGFSIYRQSVASSDVSSASSTAGTASAQRGTAVGDLQTLDSDNDLYANFDLLDDMDGQQDAPTNQ